MANCQIGVSVHAATDVASCPLDWRLFIPEAWDDTCVETTEDAGRAATRRARAGIPDTVRHRPKWEQALEVLDELAAWGLAPPLICADAAFEFPACSGRGRPPARASCQSAPIQAQDLVATLGAEAFQPVTW